MQLTEGANGSKKKISTLTKKTLSKETTKKKLLLSGLELFSKYGFETATTKKISEHAGVNEALINRYFKSKSGLLNAIINEFIIKVELEVRQYPHGETLEKDITNFIYAALSDFTRNPKVLKLTFPLIFTNPQLQRKIRSKLEIPNERLMTQLKKFQKQKVIHPSRNLIEIADIINFFISGIVNDSVGLKVGLTAKDTMIQNLARMIAQDFSRPDPDSYLVNGKKETVSW